MGAKYHGEALVGAALESEGEKEEKLQRQREEDARPRHSHIYDRYLEMTKDASFSAICGGLTDDLIFQFANKVGFDYREREAFDGKIPELRMKEKRRIAEEWAEAMMSNALHDAAILDGMSPMMASMKYKKYDKKYFDELEKKFWS